MCVEGEVCVGLWNVTGCGVDVGVGVWSGGKGCVCVCGDVWSGVDWWWRVRVYVMCCVVWTSNGVCVCVMYILELGAHG